MHLRPKSLILDLLSTMPSTAVAVRFLVAAAGLFSIDENATRVALTRLLACGLVERDERGAYRLGAAARPVHEKVRSWRNAEALVRPWDGSWVGVVGGGLRSGRDRRARARKRAIELVGLKALRPGLWVRPDNLRDGIEGARAALARLVDDGGPGRPGGVEEASVFRLDRFSSDDLERALRLWPVAELERGYRLAVDRLAQSTRRLAGVAEAEAMVETFLIGGSVLRQLALDPLLPDPILDTRQRRAMIEAMRVYDGLGRSLWSGFLHRHGVAASSAPMDQRLWGRHDAAFSPLASEGVPA